MSHLMENKLPLHLQEVIFSSPIPQVSRQISKLVRAGVLRKIAPRVYSPNRVEAIEIIVRRNIFQILGNLYPGALLSHRSAFEFQPTKTGQLFLTTTYTKKVRFPGITLQFLEGHSVIDGDNRFSGELYASQGARAFLENLQVSKKSGSESKCLPLSELEDRLEQIIRVNGEDELNQLRDRARVISLKLEMSKEFEKLNRIISALLTTKTAKWLSSPLAIARAFGMPYDPSRMELFEILFRELKSREFPYRKEQNTTPAAFRNFAFFESYFSNYIEGTVFEIDEAKQIIQMNSPLPARKEDSHDVLGTYQLVSNKKEMQKTPSTADELLKICSFRHSILMRARLDKKPGQFKDKNNFAGGTAFVDFNLVRGTLVQSFDFYAALDHPFAKAAYMMFVLSEVHPFLDGNGRIARVMMNAELVAADQAKIMIPTVFRDDYMGALKKLTRLRKCETFINMLQRAHAFSANVYDQSLEGMQAYLSSCNSFLDDSSAILKIVPR
jgi:Fic family protein